MDNVTVMQSLYKLICCCEMSAQLVRGTLEVAGLAGKKRKIQTKKWRQEFAGQEESRWVKD
jgi:hypothetical protein